MKPRRTISIRLDTYEAISARAIEEGRSKGSIVEELIASYLKRKTPGTLHATMQGEYVAAQKKKSAPAKMIAILDGTDDPDQSHRAPTSRPTEKRPGRTVLF